MAVTPPHKLIPQKLSDGLTVWACKAWCCGQSAPPDGEPRQLDLFGDPRDR